MSEKISISPGGEKFPLPKPEDYPVEFEILKKRVDEFCPNYTLLKRR